MMSGMKTAAFALVFIAILVEVGCRRTPDYVVVHVYRNAHSPIGRELDRRFYEFSAERPLLPSGKAIVVATIESNDYKQMLRERIASELKPELIVLDSPEDINVNPDVKSEAARYTNVCGAVRSCAAPVPAIIPSWVPNGEELEATKRVLKALEAK